MPSPCISFNFCNSQQSTIIPHYDIYTHTHIGSSSRTHIHTYIPHHVHTHIHTFPITYIHTYTHSPLCTCIHTFPITYIRTYVHSVMYIHTYILHCVHTYIPHCVHTCIQTYIPHYVHTHLHTFPVMYIHSYIHTYILHYVHTHIQETKLQTCPPMGPRPLVSEQHSGDPTPAAPPHRKAWRFPLPCSLPHLCRLFGVWQSTFRKEVRSFC